jgi:hypothetical protein
MLVFKFAAVEAQLDEDTESPAQVAIFAPVVRALYNNMFASVLWESELAASF